jgi:hypothetical protein
MRLGEWMDEVTNALYNQPKQGVHWVASHGSRPKWSRHDAMVLGKTPDPDAPEYGEPDFDNSIYQVETSARSFASEAEQRRVLRERERSPKPSRRSDVIGIAMRQAAQAFGGTDRVFNAAGFGVAFMRIMNLRGSLDGEVVRGMLCGRRDVDILDDDAHFRIRGGLP